MAEDLAEFRRTNISEVVRAKNTLEATLEALPDAVVLLDAGGRDPVDEPGGGESPRLGRCARATVTRRSATSTGWICDAVSESDRRGERDTAAEPT